MLATVPGSHRNQGDLEAYFYRITKDRKNEISVNANIVGRE